MKAGTAALVVGLIVFALFASYAWVSLSELKMKYQHAVSAKEALETRYGTLKKNYAELSSKYTSLQSEYGKLQAKLGDYL